MAALSCVMIGGIPRGVQRSDLLEHFGSASCGGGTVEYILHPLGNDLSMAVIKFVEDRVASSILRHNHLLHGVQVQVSLLPRQVLSQCQADVDPLIVAGLPDIVACMDLLRTDFGVKVTFDSILNKMILYGSFLQIQFAQSALNSIYRQQEEIRQKKLSEATERTINLPLKSSGNELNHFQNKGLHQDARSFSSLSFQSDHFSEVESPARTLHMEDLQALLPRKTETPRAGDIPVATPPHSIRSNASVEQSVQEIFMQQLNESLQSLGGMSVEMKVQKSAPSDVSSIPPDGSPYLRSASTVDAMFATPELQKKPGPRPSESMEQDALQVNGDMMTTGTTGKSDQRVIVEFDTQLFDYMRRIHGRSLKDLERSYQVQLQYKKKDNLTMVRILSAENGDSLVASNQAKNSLINLYKTLVHAVTIRDITIRGLAPKKRALLDQVITKVKEDFRSSVFVDTRDKTKITLTGEDEHIQTAEMYIRNTLDLKKESEIVKPKMVFMMQSSNNPKTILNEGTGKNTQDIASETQATNTLTDNMSHSTRSADLQAELSLKEEEGNNISYTLETALEGNQSSRSSITSPRESTRGFRKGRNTSASAIVTSPRGSVESLRSARSSVYSPRNSVTSPRQSLSARRESPREASSSQTYLRESLSSSLKSSKDFRSTEEMSINLNASTRSPRQSPRESSMHNRTMEEKILTPRSSDDLKSSKVSLNGSNATAAWPAPDPVSGSPRIEHQAISKSIQFSMQTSITGVTPLSSQNLSTADLTGMSYTSTGQSLHLGKSADLNISQGSVTSDTNNHLSRVSFVSTGEFQASGELRFPEEPERFKFVTKEGVKVSVYKGALASADVDVIVCPVSEDLRLLRDVALEISNAAGYELQEKCTERVVKHGALKISDVFAAPAAGSLRCQYVLCTAGPMWCLYPDKLVCETVLKQTFINTLSAANEDLKATTIALPPISTGELGVPADVCAWAMLAGIEEYSSTTSNNGIKEIHIINKDAKTTAIIGQTLQEVLVERESAQATPVLSPRAAEPENLDNDIPFIIKLSAACVKIAEKAGAIIRDILKRGELGIVEKGINDLQTEADRSAERCIVASLKAQFPGIVTVGEESGKTTEIDVQPDWIEMGKSPEVLEACKEFSAELYNIEVGDVVVWVDPLDGTSEYTQGLLEHVTTLIGVGVRGKATAGVIHQPFYNYQAAAFVPRGRSMWGIIGVGAYGFEHQTAPPDVNIIVTTRSHGSGAVGEAVSACEPTEVVRVGGCGHKVALVLEGKANAYVFASPGCKKWDTAAPEAILHAAGGTLTDIHGNQLEYWEDIQRRNAAGVLATPANGNHTWYLSKIPDSVKEALPVIANTTKLADPMHSLTSLTTAEVEPKEVEAPFIVQLTAACVCISERAGAIIRDILKRGELGIIEKGISDLQTEADRSAERCIVASLKAQFPGIVTVGEESGKTTEIDVQPDWIEMGKSPEVLEACKEFSAELYNIEVGDVVVWVDPLDGTSEYTQGLLEHVTTLIGVGVRGKATAGVIHQPFYNYQAAAFVPRGRSMWGIVGVGAYGFEHKTAPQDVNIIVTTRSHGSGAVGEAVSACEPTEVVRVGGCGHKVALVLEGKANAYVFASPGCKKWDTAAPEAILHAAGGTLTDIHGNQLEYWEDIQRRNAAGVLATPANGNHAWYLSKIPDSVKEALPVIANTTKLADPMHSLTSPKTAEVEPKEKVAPFIVQLTAACVCISERAGSIIRHILKRGELGIVEKGINDLQTEADRSAERCIVASLKAQFPGIVTVGEESGKTTEIDVQPDWIEMGKSPEVLEACKEFSEELYNVEVGDVVVWVDPLDGTSEYTQGLLEHVTTLIGVGVRGKATAGVIHQPFYNYQAAAFVPRGRSMWGIVGVGAYGYEDNTAPPDVNIIVTTRSHGSGAVGEAVSACEPTEVVRVGGCGHKVALVLEGKANAYVFASPGCKKWDTAAPEAILHAAGGTLTDIHGNQLEYWEDIQRRNAAGVLATPANGNHAWYLSKIPDSVKEALPVIANTTKLADPMHNLTPTNTTHNLSESVGQLHHREGQIELGEGNSSAEKPISIEDPENIDNLCQPENGEMSFEVDRKIQLPGYSGSTTIVITYSFPAGNQKEDPPKPGVPYEAASFTAYLPNTQDGRHVLQLLRKAFNLRMTFKLKHTFHNDDDPRKITWAHIPHKTAIDGGIAGNGYPDETYVEELVELLHSRGIKDDPQPSVDD